jgi:hypothetical protein
MRGITFFRAPRNSGNSQCLSAWPGRRRRSVCHSLRIVYVRGSVTVDLRGSLNMYTLFPVLLLSRSYAMEPDH